MYFTRGLKLLSTSKNMNKIPLCFSVKHTFKKVLLLCKVIKSVFSLCNILKFVACLLLAS